MTITVHTRASKRLLPNAGAAVPYQGSSTLTRSSESNVHPRPGGQYGLDVLPKSHGDELLD